MSTRESECTFSHTLRMWGHPATLEACEHFGQAHVELLRFEHEGEPYWAAGAHWRGQYVEGGVYEGQSDLLPRDWEILRAGLRKGEYEDATPFDRGQR